MHVQHPRRWTSASSPDESEPPAALNVTPSGPTLIQVLTNLALNRGGQRRATIAAALFPEANIERPTNILNTNFTRTRQLSTK